MRPALPAILILAALLSGAAPSDAPAQTSSAASAPKDARHKTCGDDVLDLSTDALNRKCVAAAGRLAASRKDELVLRMDDGTRKVFKDPSDLAEDAYGYALVDFWPEQHVFFIDFAMDDGGISTVVFGKTGLAVDCKYASPHLSPSGVSLLLEDNGDPSDPSSFTMIETNGGTSAKTVWRSKDDPTTISTHGLDFVGWDSDTKARFKLGNGPDGFVLLVRADDGHWHYDLAGAPPPEKADANSPPAAPPADAGAPMELHPEHRQ